MKIYRGLFIILLIFIANICNANDTIKKKGLHDCIMMALKNNYAIKQSKLDEMIAAMKTKEIKADLLPQINASTGLTDNMSSPVVILPGELLGIANTDIPVELVTPYELGARIDISQVIFDATLFTGIKTAKNIQELIALKKELNEEELIYNVSIIFYDILYGEQLLSNLNSNLSMQDSLYVYMSHREKQDLIRKIDLNRIKVEISNIKIQIKQLIAKIDQQKRYLKILIGSPINEALFLDNYGLEDINLPVDLEREQLQILNIKEVEVLNKQKKIEQLAIKNINTQYIPTLSFVASGGYLFQSNDLKMANTNSWFDYSFIGIRLNIPIFDGLRKQKQRRQVEFKIQKINEEIEFAQNKVVASYEDAIQLLFIGFQSISVQEENLKLAEEIYKQSRLLYKEGLYSTTDLLQAEVTFQKAQSAYWLEIIKYKKAELDLMKTKGTLNNLLNYK